MLSIANGIIVVVMTANVPGVTDQHGNIRGKIDGVDVIKLKGGDSPALPSLAEAQEATVETLKRDRRDCQLGNAKACVRQALVAMILKPNEDHHKVISAKYATLACNLDDMEGCEILASAYNDGRGVPKDPRMSAVLHAKTCDVAGSIHGCRIAGGTFLELREFALAAEYWRKGCQLETSILCLNYSTLMFQGGNGLTPDREEALLYARIYNEWSAIQRAERSSQPRN